MITNGLYDPTHSGDLAAVLEWLKVHPNDLNSPIGDGYTPLHVAALFGHEPIVRELIAYGALVNVEAANASHATALHAAVCFRDENVADRIPRILIECGAELNGAQAGGVTALHHAVNRCSLKLVQTLIEAGADPFLKDDQGRSASDLAKQLALKGAFSLQN
jgi:uncharacterized protein